MRILTLSLFFVVVITGCLEKRPVATTETPSTEEGDSERLNDFPVEVASFHRSKLFRFSSDLSDFSITYYDVDPLSKNTATLYFYPRPSDVEQRIEIEQAEVLNTHPGSRIVSRTNEKLTCDGVEYDSTRVTFEFSDSSTGQPLEFWSQLLLVALPNKMFKVRCTSPLECGPRAEDNLNLLLTRISWAK